MIQKLSTGLKRELHRSSVGTVVTCQACSKFLDWRRAVSFETYPDKTPKVWCAECWDTLVRADPMNKQLNHLDGRLLVAGKPVV